MSELEEKLGSILNDPNMMQQIMGMAQMLSSGPHAQDESKKDSPPVQPAAPAIDPKLLQTLVGITQNQGMDPNQEYLIKALQPYLSRERLQKLERAMGAARMAGAASAFLNAGGLRMLSQR